MATETIQHFLGLGHSYEIWCHRCHHHATMDMLKLRDRLGPDHGVLHDDLIHFFVCSKCGSKDLGLIRSNGDGNSHEMVFPSQKNLYQKAKGV